MSRTGQEEVTLFLMNMADLQDKDGVVVYL